eukprot:137913-Chlamydomonas_euryale.AAC.2
MQRSDLHVQLVHPIQHMHAAQCSIWTFTSGSCIPCSICTQRSPAREVYHVARARHAAQEVLHAVPHPRNDSHACMLNAAPMCSTPRPATLWTGRGIATDRAIDILAALWAARRCEASAAGGMRHG